MTGLSTRFLVIDDFLGRDASATLLEQILAGAERFTPSHVRLSSGFGEASGIRSSLRLPGRVGVDLAHFTAAITGRFDEWLAATGMPHFPISHAERSIVAHGDGDFYRAHVDTRTRPDNDARDSVRVLSCVYYLHARPARFTGGELVLHRLGARAGSDPAAVIEPAHDRLAVFPSFVPHEVREIACPSGRFEDSRFSINCWLHRAVAGRGDNDPASAAREGIRQS